ncbi:efflux RND transporter periplasmic adaptor subunit [Compostibacter hankyongensis]|uniref:Efflux RND transporter periplasmic adaptor subunit n=1 Tax=Compostibacter hankyongensis TaxID=1007089 RepID=A0ABP8FDQ3_9BACT
MKKKTLYYLIAGVVLLIIVLLLLKSKGVIGGNNGTKVAVERTAYRDVVQTVSASGKIYPEVEVKVSSDVSGEIVELPVQEGDSVTKGQVVARIYGDIYNSQRERSQATVSQSQAQLANSQAALGATKATLEEQQAAFERNKQLFDQKVISRQEFEQSQSAYQQALSNYKAAEAQINSMKYALAASRADLSQAAENLRRTTIAAPMSGYVSLLSVEKGERVVGTAQMTGTEMMRVANMDAMEVRVDVGENDIPKVYLGDTALIDVDAYNGRRFKGIVTQLASSSGDAAAQQLTGSSSSSSTGSATQVANYTVRIRILKSSYEDLLDPRHRNHFPFRPGMSANVDIQTRRRSHVLTVPITAVATRDDTSSKAAPKSGVTASGADAAVGVFTLQRDGTVKYVHIKTGIQNDTYIEVTSGLGDSVQVVTAPYSAISRTLTNGAKVKVTPRSQLFEAQ